MAAALLGRLATGMRDMGRQHPRAGSRRTASSLSSTGYGIDATCFAWVTAMPWGRHKQETTQANAKEFRQ
jgi:hypothetical protein